MKMIFPIILIVTFITFLFCLGHFVVYKSLIHIFNISNSRIIGSLRLFFIIGTISFVSMSLIVNISYTKIGAILYGASAVWIGTLYFLFIASVLYFLILGISLSLGLNLFPARMIGAFLLIFAIGTSVYGVIHSFNINTVKYDVSIENLPEEWINKNILIFSDTHFGNIRNLKFGEKLVNKINKENPEIVLIAGDYYDGPPTNKEDIAMLLSGIKSKKGIFFTPGNHEDYGDSVGFNQSLEKANVKILNNSFLDVDGLQIAGVDYTSGSQSELLLNVLSDLNLESNLPKILIKHSPTNIQIVNEKGFDLVLSGHVHKGQLWPGPIIAKKIFKEFYYGLSYLGKTAVVTTSGAGTWGPPQRVLTNSEIVIIRLLKK